MPRRSTLRPWLLAALALTAGAGCRPRNELIVFHATQLSRLFGELAERLATSDPPWTARLEPSSSTLAAAKVVEHGLRADVLALGDAPTADELAAQGRLARRVTFASDELVLAHLAHSPGADALTSDGWPDIVLRPGVRLGCVDPTLAPVGRLARRAWARVADAQRRPGLPDRLWAACATRALATDELELVTLLEGKAVDYAFLFASTVEAHRLEVTRLPATDLGQSATDGAITYELLVLRDAPNPAGARALLALLTSEDGRRRLQRLGFHPTEASP